MDESALANYREILTVDPPADLTDEQRAGFDHLFGDVWPDPALGRRERRLVTITCLAHAVTPAPIEAHVYAALRTGDLTIEEMLEVVLHFAVYCGWPKASNLEMCVRSSWARVRQDRGEEPVPFPARSADELGPTDVEARLQGGEQEFRDVNLIGAPPRDTPFQHAGILNYVFGHVWRRPGLSRRDRRFVTLAAVALCQAPVPISSHVGSALASGDVSRDEMAEVIRQFAQYSRRGLSDALTEAVAATA